MFIIKKEKVMAKDSVYRITELVGTSKKFLR